MSVGAIRTKPQMGRVRLIVTALGLSACALALGGLLHAACSAFSWTNFLMSDYGVYTNTVWNLGRGNGFSFLVDHDYLATHLSFSLALLGPLYHVWDHPMLLIVVQWVFLAAGAGVLWRLALRLRVPPHLAAGIAFLYIGYPLTQSVMVSEFHGVSAYLLLVPCLVYCLECRKQWTLVPLLILLGMREDTGFLLPAVLLSYAVRDGWKPGYVYAVASAGYALFAVFWLYPHLTGGTLVAMRADQGAAFGLFDSLHGQGLLTRARATGWVALALAPFLLLPGRGRLALLLFPALAYIFAMGSGVPRQHGLQFHYPAAIMAFAGAAMVVACARARIHRHPRRSMVLAVSVMAVTVTAHAFSGFARCGGRSTRVYRSIHVGGMHLLRVARDIPRSGLLLCNDRLAVFAANRKDIVTWRYWKRETHEPDLILCRMKELVDYEGKWPTRVLRDGTFGVLAQHFPYVILKRGHPSIETDDLIRALDARIIAASSTSSGGGTDRYMEGVGLVRHWHGDGDRAHAVVAHGASVELPAGDYIARFHYGAAAPRADISGHWGHFLIFERGASQVGQVAEAGIPKLSTDRGAFRVAEVPFTVGPDRRVEPRITAGDAELWLHSISFEKRNG